MTSSATISAAAPTLSATLIQVSGALCLIVLVILGAAWLARRYGLAQPRSRHGELNICASVSVGQREKVVIVAVENARLVLGVTASQITHLHTLPAAEQTVPADNQTPGNFRQMMRALRQRDGGSA
ncbi:flagellar biosynthetic protein FliO [Entomohabitans teleogrylli]|uniref:flagellar biosynthetic protein FliO n=1 Tax=Entomohabitans teleogrylli TaxID=1384589 RepID=UPI00073D8DCD|nr:flagellar biosynthetic protein FliO [Entomohabitans teleogrylli]